jgi:hypothetical protein
MKHQKTSPTAPRARTAAAAASSVLLMLACVPALASGPSPGPGAVHVAASERDLEGLWLPLPGAANAPGAGAGPPPERPVQLTGSTLQCAPVQRLNGSGGGMSTLIIQSADEIVMISEEDMDIARKIYLHASHPRHLAAQPNGHSIGHWQGGTLVIDTVGYADRDGHDNGEHIVEYLSRHGELLRDRMVIHERDGSTREQQLSWAWRPDLQFNENVCEEGFDRYQVINGKLDNPNVAPAREP